MASIIEQLTSLLECNKIFNEHIKDYIEVLVDYYGEEQRTYIEEKFNQVIFVGYISETQLENIISAIEEEKSDILYNEIVNGLNIDKKLLFGEDASFVYMKNHPIHKYQSYYEEYILNDDEKREKYCHVYYEMLCSKLSLSGIKETISYEEYKELIETRTIPEKFKNTSDEIKQMMLSFSDIDSIEKDGKKMYEDKKIEAVNILKKIYPDITIENLEEKTTELTELNELLPKYKRAYEEYTQFMSNYKKYYDIIKHNKELEKALTQKYTRQLLLEVIDDLPETFYKEIKNYTEEANNSNKLSYQLINIIGYLNTPGLLEYFTSDISEKLRSEKTAEWVKEFIIENRIKYFKSIGIDLGDDYNNYLKGNIPWPEEQKADDFIAKKQKIANDYNIEYYSQCYPQNEIIEEMKNRGFMDIDLAGLASIYMSNMTSFTPNIIRDGQEYKPTGIVFINFNIYVLKYIDNIILHELNHLYEMELIDVNENDNTYTFTEGWEIIKEYISSEKKQIIMDPEIREYELLSEIINEKITQEMCKRMVDRGVQILGLISEESYKNNTSYEETNYLINDFFETYKKIIIASRKNMQVIYDEIGEENFKALNKLFDIHNEHLGGVEWQKFLNDYKEYKKNKLNELSPRMKVFMQLVTERNSILKKMEEFNRIAHSDHRQDESDFVEAVGHNRIAKGVREASVSINRLPVDGNKGR